MNDLENQKPENSGSALKEITDTVQKLAIAKAKLAKLEGRHAAKQIQRMIITAVFASVMFFVGVTLLIVAASYGLEGISGLHHVWWFLIFGGSAVIISAVVAFSSLRRFKRDFKPLEQSLAEIQEDLAWIREYQQPQDSEK